MCVYVAFVLWAKQELQYFVSVFSGQVFITKYNLSAVAECVTEATCYCSQVLHLRCFVSLCLVMPHFAESRFAESQFAESQFPKTCVIYLFS